MIKTAIKHWIYEICIDTFFDGIFKNFDIQEFKIKDYKVGDCLELKVHIIELNRNMYFNKCKVLYKKGGNMIIVSYDINYPIYFILKKYIITDVIENLKENFEDHFKK